MKYTQLQRWHQHRLVYNMMFSPDAWKPWAHYPFQVQSIYNRRMKEEITKEEYHKNWKNHYTFAQEIVFFASVPGTCKNGFDDF